MRRRLVAPVGLALLLAILPTPASADEPAPTRGASLDDDLDVLTTIVMGKTVGSSTGPSAPGATAASVVKGGPLIEWRNQTAHCVLSGAALCSEYKLCPDGSYELRYDQYTDGVFTGKVTHCEGDEVSTGAPPLPPGPTFGDIIAAAKQTPVPAAKITIQPPGGETLVNLPTVFSTDVQAFTHTETVKNVTIVYTLTPAQFTWTFGDGSDPQVTTTPGTPWTQGADINTLFTHTYKTTGKNNKVSLSVAWTATYKKPNGETGPIPDVINKDSEAVSLDILEAAPILTD